MEREVISVPAVKYTLEENEFRCYCILQSFSNFVQKIIICFVFFWKKKKLKENLNVFRVPTWNHSNSNISNILWERSWASILQYVGTLGRKEVELWKFQQVSAAKPFTFYKNWPDYVLVQILPWLCDKNYKNVSCQRISVKLKKLGILLNIQGLCS